MGVLKNAHWYDVYRRRITTESSWRRGYFNSVSVKFEAGSTFEPVAVIRRSLSIATGVFLEHSQRDGEEWLNTWYYIENAAHQGLKRNHGKFASYTFSDVTSSWAPHKCTCDLVPGPNHIGDHYAVYIKQQYNQQSEHLQSLVISTRGKGTQHEYAAVDILKKPK